MVAFLLFGFGLLVVSLSKQGALRARVRSGSLQGLSPLEVAGILNADYERGHLQLAALEAAATAWVRVPAPPLLALNIFVCLDVAAGRYREALEWRGRWGSKPDALLLINEAEALACLGRLEESLNHLGETPPASHWLASGWVSHRLWVLSELGRLDAARTLSRDPRLDTWFFPHAYRAERHFSRFAFALASRDFALAHQALDAAAGVAKRESSRRNLAFYRGRLALAEGRDEEAFAHFARGAASVYRRQGGPSLLEWGDALQRLGREAEAREKWTWCVEQDPQSPAADEAKKRLSPSPQPSPPSGERE